MFLSVYFFIKNTNLFIFQISFLYRFKTLRQVPPAEMEAVLRSHPDIQEAAVIGVPDERCGEIPKAFVVTTKGSKVTEDDIKDFIKSKVSEYKQLRGKVFQFTFNANVIYDVMFCI